LACSPDRSSIPSCRGAFSLLQSEIEATFPALARRAGDGWSFPDALPAAVALALL
jgi:hypothetical protein